MAKSGSFSGTASGRYANHYDVRIDWSIEQSITNNQSTITCKMYFVHDWGINIGSRTNNITIGSTTYSITSSSINEDSTSKHEHYIGSCSKIITHNGDGTHPDIAISSTFYLKAYLGSEETYIGGISAFKTISIDTIPRTSSPSLSASNGYMGNPITIYTNSKSSAFTHTLHYNVGDGRVLIAENITNNYTWTVPMSLVSKVTVGKSLAVTFWLETYNGSFKVGEDSVVFTAYVPETSDTKPTLTFTTASIGAPASWVETPYVQGKSKVEATITGSAKSGATITSYAMTIGGVTNTSSSNVITSDTLQDYGQVQVTCMVTDSRTILSSQEKQYITVVPYGKPTLNPNGSNSSIVCARCDSTGKLNNTGTSLKLSLTAKWFSLAEKENTAILYVKYVTETTDSGWKQQTATTLGGGPEKNYVSWIDFDGIASGVTLDLDKEYTVYVRITDRFGLYEEIPFQIPSQEVCFHLREGGRGAGFGEYAEEENVLSIDEKWTLKVKGALAVLMANGSRMPIIVESGTVTGTTNYTNTTDIKWSYRKWSDGMAECWCTCKCIDVHCNNAWGVLYETEGYGGIDYPFAFTERPLQLLSISKSEAGLMIEYPLSSYAATSTNTGLWWFVRPNQADISDAYMDIYVRGKWKLNTT